MNENINNTSATVEEENDTILFMDKYGYLHSTREEALEANRED